MAFWKTQTSTSLGPKEFAFVRDACKRYLPATDAGVDASLTIPSTDAAEKCAAAILEWFRTR
jgi:hypothetical protein